MHCVLIRLECASGARAVLQRGYVRTVFEIKVLVCTRVTVVL